MQKLVALRKEFNEPMIISSGYRSIAYNTTISGASNVGKGKFVGEKIAETAETTVSTKSNRWFSCS